MRGLAWAALLFTLGCSGVGSDSDPLDTGGADAAPAPAVGGDDADGSSASGLPDGGEAAPDAGEIAPDAAGGGCSPCQLVPQCGCDGAQACDLGGANPAGGTTVCRPVLVPGTATSTCNDSTSCAAGYVCLGSGAGEASCKRYCASDADCDGGGGVCTIEVTSGGTPIPGVKVCSPRCDPFTASGCPDGWACGAFSDPQEQRTFTWCQVAGTGTQNATCSDDGQCAAGFTCVNVAGGRRCKKYCDKGDGNPGCPSFQACVGLVDGAGAPLVVAGVTYGVCI